MYEQFGVEGVKAFQKTVDYCHEKDLVVIGDVKRGRYRIYIFSICYRTSWKSTDRKQELFYI